MSRKKTILLFFLLLTFFLCPEGARAYYPGGATEDGTVKAKQQVFEESVFGNDQFNQESHSYSSVENIIVSLNNMIIGCVSQSCKEKLNANAGGAVGSVSNLIASLYAAPPASSAYYLADLGQRLNITQPAYAQGIGFSGLSMLLPLWRNIRNIAYIFFTIAFIVTGFAIMFRAKINPQTVITIQSAIPRVVVALILVTFSYAIVGLVIDSIYLLIALIVNIFQNAGGLVDLGPDPFRKYTGMNFWGLIGEIFGTGFGEVFGGLTIIQGVIIGLVAIFAGPALGIITALPALIISLIFLWAVFSTFFSLLLAYIRIIISLLVAPIQLMISILPGQNTFSPWLKDLISNALAFPTVIAMLLLAKTFAQNTTSGVWAPPIISSDAQAGGTVGGILALGVLLMTPKAIDIIKSLFEGQAFQYGAALKGAIVNPPATVVGWGESITKSAQGGLLGSVKSRVKIGGIWGAHRDQFSKQAQQAEQVKMEKEQQIEDTQRISNKGIPKATREAAERKI